MNYVLVFFLKGNNKNAEIQFVRIHTRTHTHSMDPLVCPKSSRMWNKL